MALEELRGRLYDRIMGKIDFSREMPDSEILDLIDEEIVGESFAHGMELSDMKKLRRELFYSIRKLDVLQELIDDPAITEIMINNSDSIFIERDGAITPYPQHFASPQKLDDVIQAIVSACNRTVNAGDPIADARLPGGERVNVVLPPISLGGPTVTIRRFPDDPIRMKDLIRFGSVSQEAAEFLQRLVCAGCNIFISGGTGSGKTTFLNALSDYIPESERIITIEDNAELQIRHIPNLVRLEARSAGPGGHPHIAPHAPGPHHRRGGARKRGDRHAAGDEYRAPRLNIFPTKKSPFQRHLSHTPSQKGDTQKRHR